MSLRSTGLDFPVTYQTLFTFHNTSHLRRTPKFVLPGSDCFSDCRFMREMLSRERPDVEKSV